MDIQCDAYMNRKQDTAGPQLFSREVVNNLTFACKNMQRQLISCVPYRQVTAQPDTEALQWKHVLNAVFKGGLELSWLNSLGVKHLRNCEEVITVGFVKGLMILAFFEE